MELIEKLIWILLEFVAATQKSAFLCEPPSDSVVRLFRQKKNRVGIDAAMGTRGYSSVYAYKLQPIYWRVPRLDSQPILSFQNDTVYIQIDNLSP